VAELTGAPLHVAHVSSRGAVERLREAKRRGVPVTADVTPHHLTWTDEALLGFETLAKVIPPLREAEDRDALRAGLADGTIDCIATDHAPHSDLEKDCELEEALPGMIGLETALPLVLQLVRDGVLPRRRAIEALTTGPARVLRRDASVLGATDVTVIDPDHAWTVTRASLRSKSSNTLLRGREVRGAARLTLARGRVIFARD
jgi:dihydroorotase